MVLRLLSTGSIPGGLGPRLGTTRERPMVPIEAKSPRRQRSPREAKKPKRGKSLREKGGYPNELL